MMNSRKRKLLRNRCNSYMKLYVSCGLKQFKTWWSSLLSFATWAVAKERPEKFRILTGLQPWSLRFRCNDSVVGPAKAATTQGVPDIGQNSRSCLAHSNVKASKRLTRTGLLFFWWYLEMVNLIKQNNTFSVSHWTGLITRKRRQLQSCLKTQQDVFWEPPLSRVHAELPFVTMTSLNW